ncbi:hypothetical protein PIB30_016241 [Stylosanthes scabra]|uniref:Transposase MuDR plant domain-containing protein n=1 Tax=Stylosanthes scabra TaxID=79078 RepID=A0ABU6X5L1_9FABA|nr:hypothetical protein [Stylosanthes scabra]
MGLEQLKAFILRSIGEHRRRVQKVYYRFPHEVDGIFHFKRYGLYAILIDEGNSSEADSQSGGGVSRNIPRLMVDLNRLPKGSSEGSISDSNILMTEILDSHDESVIGDPATHDYQLNHDSDNDQEDNEPVVVPQSEEDDEEEEDEVEEQRVNYFQWAQPAYAQPEMTRQYDHPAHFRSLNLDAMNLGSFGFQGGPDDDPVDEFEVGQQFDDKEAVLMAVKTYSIRRAIEYKIIESDRLKYAVQCANFGQVYQWALRVTYRRRQEK